MRATSQPEIVATAPWPISCTLRATTAATSAVMTKPAIAASRRPGRFRSDRGHAEQGTVGTERGVGVPRAPALAATAARQGPFVELDGAAAFPTSLRTTPNWSSGSTLGSYRASSRR